jgi:hypothetical protein
MDKRVLVKDRPVRPDREMDQRMQTLRYKLACHGLDSERLPWYWSDGVLYSRETGRVLATGPASPTCGFAWWKHEVDSRL